MLKKQKKEPFQLLNFRHFITDIEFFFKIIVYPIHIGTVYMYLRFNWGRSDGLYDYVGVLSTGLGRESAYFTT